MKANPIDSAVSLATWTTASTLNREGIVSSQSSRYNKVSLQLSTQMLATYRYFVSFMKTLGARLWPKGNKHKLEDLFTHLEG